MLTVYDHGMCFSAFLFACLHLKDHRDPGITFSQEVRVDFSLSPDSNVYCNLRLGRTDMGELCDTLAESPYTEAKHYGRGKKGQSRLYYIFL